MIRRPENEIGGGMVFFLLLVVLGIGVIVIIGLCKFAGMTLNQIKQLFAA